jgi:hypothetical protein
MKLVFKSTPSSERTITAYSPPCVVNHKITNELHLLMTLPRIGINRYRVFDHLGRQVSSFELLGDLNKFYMLAEKGSSVVIENV